MFPIWRFEGIDFKTLFPPKQIFFIDIKMCFMAIGNYRMNFRAAHKRLRTQLQLAQISQMKKGNPRLLRNSKLFSIFFLL